MIRWEYAVVQVQSTSDKEGWKDTFYFYGPGDAELQPLNGSSSVDILNHLGAQGWELVQVATRYAGLFSGKWASNLPYQQADAILRQFWLKRPIS